MNQLLYEILRGLKYVGVGLGIILLGPIILPLEGLLACIRHYRPSELRKRRAKREEKERARNQERSPKIQEEIQLEQVPTAAKPSTKAQELQPPKAATRNTFDDAPPEYSA